ncbi:MAG: N-acetylneuraminate synthase [Halopseudomonas sp.]
MSEQVYIIAEAGVNHNGDPDMALALVDAAADAGVDAVKFQTFKANLLVTDDAPKADYQKETTGSSESQLQMLQRLELSYAHHHTLMARCRQKGIDFLSTAFDHQSLEFLVDDLRLSRLKIPSGELTNAPLVLAHAQQGCELIVSTGMATLAEIEAALGVIAFGLTMPPDHPPSQVAFAQSLASAAGQHALQQRVILLHCTTEYPAPVSEVNLTAMNSLAERFGLKVGYSDHTAGITVPIAAVALGATLIEKHFTLDRNLEGPDHLASLEPTELGDMVTAIRTVQDALGDGVKAPQPSELKNRAIARKSLVAASDIIAGDIYTSDNVTTKRPEGGLSPARYWDILGKKAPVDIRRGAFVRD